MIGPRPTSRDERSWAPDGRVRWTGAMDLKAALAASRAGVATLAVGLYPKMLLDRIQPAVEAMRFLR